MQITLLTNVYAGRNLNEGETHDISDEIAKSLIEDGYAVEAKEGAANAPAPLVSEPVASASPAENPVEQSQPVTEVTAPEAQIAQEQVPAPEVTTVPVQEVPSNQPTEQEINETLQALESAPSQPESSAPLQ
jgi:hypothetical protein